MTTEMLAAEIAALSEKAQDYKQKATDSFVAFTQDGDDGHRVMGNKWATCSKELSKTSERLQKILTA